MAEKNASDAFGRIFSRQSAAHLLALDIMNEVPQKKGISALGWVGIGCGSVLLIGIVVVSLLIGWCNRKVGEVKQNPERFMAEVAINAHPDYSVVTSNDETKEMTIKEDKTGKETTFSYKDIADGKFAMKSSDGENIEVGMVKPEELPDFVKVMEGGVMSSGYQSKATGALTGMILYTVNDTPENVIAFYEKSVDSWNNVSTSKSNFSLGDTVQHSLNVSDATRKINVTAQKESQQTTVTVTFEQK